MAQKFLCVYHDMIPTLEKLQPAEVGRLILAALKYDATGEQPASLPGKEDLIWPMIMAQIDRANASYEAKCETNRQNALKRYDGMRPHTTACDGTQYNKNTIQEENKRREEERKTEPKAQAPKGDVFAEFAGEDQALLSALREFSAFRKALKKPLTEPAERRLTKRLLDQFPREEWIPVLNQSVDKGWQDVYPLQDPRQNPSRKEKVTNNIFAEIAMEEGIF